MSICRDCGVGITFACFCDFDVIFFTNLNYCAKDSASVIVWCLQIYPVCGAVKWKGASSPTTLFKGKCVSLAFISF
jgi:hypothetical protein